MTNFLEYIQNNAKSVKLPGDLEARIASLPLPSKKREAWKYFPVKEINFSELASDKAPVASVKEAFEKHKLGTMPCICFYNGTYLKELSDTTDAVSIVEADDFNFSEEEFESSIDLANLYLSRSGYDIQVESVAKVQIIQLADEATSFLKNRISLSGLASLSLFETHVVVGNAKLCNYSDVQLAPESQLHYFSNAIVSPESQLFLNANINVTSKAKYNSIVLDTDPATTRRRASINLLEKGAETDLKGFYLVNDKAVVNHKLDINHMVPHCISKQLYKGILDGDSRVSFDGKVYVAEGAVGTDSEQLNKSMLFSNTAELDTRPQLEIYNDDVTCAHGATLGGFNTDQVFFLQSRCIPEERAVAMLAFGFAEDIFSEIADEAIHSKFSEQFQDRFKDYKVELNEF